MLLLPQSTAHEPGGQDGFWRRWFVPKRRVRPGSIVVDPPPLDQSFRGASGGHYREDKIQSGLAENLCRKTRPAQTNCTKDQLLIADLKTVPNFVHALLVSAANRIWSSNSCFHIVGLGGAHLNRRLIVGHVY